MRLHHALLFAVVFLLLQTNDVFAARCMARRVVSEEFSRASAVFSAKAIAEEYRPVKENDGSKSEEVRVVRFAVERWWKGSGDEEAVLYTAVTRLPDGTSRIWSEDFRFQVGERYLIYAFGSEERLSTNGCSRTSSLEKAGEDLQELGEGTIPFKKQASNIWNILLSNLSRPLKIIV